MQQITQIHKEYDRLQLKYGDPTLSSIYGAGCIENPDIMFIFMNPTGRNISSIPSWEGLRAPWIGTKQVWDIFENLGLLKSDIYLKIKEIKPEEWDCDFADVVYEDIQNHSVFITNLGKCTQVDARPLNNSIFKDYLNLMYKEIDIVNPKKIVTFGNQVSSILLGKNISVSNYTDNEKEVLNGYEIYPTYYPVGQGRRNMPLAIKRMKTILKE
ncbi:MAG: phage SPO1 DNA polymerase-related protein [candidate division WS6 bacterium 34_10]|uniref:Phage SPO1 DNA polymerase-related protein n=1 Tax=candidate division WS6 bacterium 34_10 TaxID=1641389 RepID=A0A124FX47_9BACT|nr:MAG: phage SPO1 DNA polymerase-related protein [candidate division WS6 bacterium 34_10]